MGSLALQHKPLAWALARQYWWLGADLDDVRQEAMTALIEAESRWDRRGAFTSFARVVIRNHLSDCLQTFGRRRVLLETVPLDEERDVSLLTVEAQVEARERLRFVLEAPLPERERAVLARAAQGYPYEEIADELGLSPSVVKWTAWRARARLRELEEAA